MNFERQAVLLNAIPLLALVALYVLAAAAVAAALVVAVAVILRGRRARAPEAGDGEREAGALPRGREAVGAFASELARAEDASAVGRLVASEVASALGVDFAGVVAIERGDARGLAAELDGEPLDWWRELRLDTEREPSAIASVLFEAAPLVVYDVPASPLVNRRLADRVGARSAVWVPLMAHDEVAGVVVAATTRAQRAFGTGEVALLQELAGEAALALARLRSVRELASALERERLVARISRRVRSELELDALLEVAAAETARALAASRCVVSLIDDTSVTRVAAEWHDPALGVVDADTDLPVSTLAVRRRTTIALDDVETAPELEGVAGARDTLRAIGARAVLATPLLVFDEPIGALAVHRRDALGWTSEDAALAEAVAREVALATHTVRLLRENEERVRHQTALLEAAQAVTSELRPDAVLQLLVDEVAELVGGDAADCYLLDANRGVLRCAAVHGLPAELVGFEFPADKGLSGQAIAARTPVTASDYRAVGDPVPSEAYRGFVHAIVAPVLWSDETIGVLGVGTADPDRPFGPDAASALGAFATLAALALRNAEAFEERSRQARIQRGFYTIASVLGEPLALSGTLDAVAQAASEALGGSFAAVVMPSGAGLALAGGQELPPSLAAALAEGLASRAAVLVTAAARQRVLASPDVAADERFEPEWREAAREAGYASLLAVPARGPRDDESAGLVLVFFAAPRTFADDDLEVAQQLARAARGALERSRLYEEERLARSLAQELARTGSRLATELDPAAVLDHVVEQAPRLVGADACAIRVLEGDELVVAAVEGADPELLGERSRAASALSGDVVQTRAPRAVDDAAADERLLADDPVLRRGFRSFLAVPLAASEGGLHGVLAVYGARPKTWRREEVEALLALAATASAALSNAELYQRVALERERSLAILANIADGIVAVDREGRVVVWNRAAEQITGVPEAEALGRTPLAVLGRSLEAEGEVRGVNRLVPVRRGGEEVWLSLTEAVMRDPAGAVAGRIYAFRDISADRLVEQIKSDFVSTVSQELRRPLTSIYGFAETLLRRDVFFGEDERRTFLGYIASESERLASIVDALLNVARLDTGDLQVNLAATDVSTVVADVVAGAEQALQLNGHRFVVDLPDEPLAADADAEKLRQVLSNLIDNAVKYSPDGGTVTVAARRLADAVQVSVADQGIGIPQAEQQRIFRKFYRGESIVARGGGGGAGLGLFIAEGLVTAMGGRITVRSSEGEGSTFTLELPASADGATAAVTEPAGTRV